MKYVVARRLSTRGEGLGNEILPWAKGFIASQVLNAKLIGPSWGLNRRKYYRNFGTTRFDFVAEDVLRRLPHFTFSKKDYYETGKNDFGEAIKIWAQGKGLFGKRSFTVVVDQMYGGYLSIRHAKPFLWGKLLNSREAISNVYEVASQIDRTKLFVAVHMRFGGDFASLPEDETARGKFNVAIPTSWYLSVCQSLKNEFGDSLHFYFFTDRGGPGFDEAVKRFNPNQVRTKGLTECSDLLLMAQADLRICSISSYSLVSSFLSSGPYIWYEPQLTHSAGLYSLWGTEEEQQRLDSPTSESARFLEQCIPGTLAEDELKGYPMSGRDRLPEAVVIQLRRKLRSKDSRTNLLEFGCLPEWVVPSRVPLKNSQIDPRA